jgi:hypothetical protein
MGLFAEPRPTEPLELTRDPAVEVRQATFGSPGRFTQVAAVVDDRSGGAPASTTSPGKDGR